MLNKRPRPAKRASNLARTRGCGPPVGSCEKSILVVTPVKTGVQTVCSWLTFLDCGFRPRNDGKRHRLIISQLLDCGRPPSMKPAGRESGWSGSERTRPCPPKGAGRGSIVKERRGLWGLPKPAQTGRAMSSLQPIKIDRPVSSYCPCFLLSCQNDKEG
jgi:hypothetical protein